MRKKPRAKAECGKMFLLGAGFIRLHRRRTAMPMDERVKPDRGDPLALPSLHPKRMGGAARRHAADPDAGGFRRELRSLNDPISLEEVVAIYLPLSRLLALYVAATQGLFKATQRFLGAEDGKMPYIIGVAGSVAAGKSTLSRVMQALLSRWPNTPKVELVTTDGFLYPNAVLESRRPDGEEGISRELRRHGALLRFLPDVKAGTAQRPRAGLFASHL